MVIKILIDRDGKSIINAEVGFVNAVKFLQSKLNEDEVIMITCTDYQFDLQSQKVLNDNEGTINESESS